MKEIKITLEGNFALEIDGLSVLQTPRLEFTTGMTAKSWQGKPLDILKEMELDIAVALESALTKLYADELSKSQESMARAESVDALVEPLSASLSGRIVEGMATDSTEDADKPEPERVDDIPI